jgi:hypothetical protein
VGLRAALDGCGKSRPHRDWIPDSLVSKETYFVTFGSRFAGVRRLSRHSMSRNEYLMLPIVFRINSARLSFPLSFVHRLFET